MKLDFINFIIQPLWKKVNSFSENVLNEPIDNIMKNIKLWEDILHNNK